jgi:hypothetical protein
MVQTRRRSERPSPTRVAAAGAIAFIVTLIVLLSIGAGVYELWLSRHPEVKGGAP